jgi:hypothetical protein
MSTALETLYTTLTIATAPEASSTVFGIHEPMVHRLLERSVLRRGCPAKWD